MSPLRRRRVGTSITEHCKLTAEPHQSSSSKQTRSGSICLVRLESDLDCTVLSVSISLCHLTTSSKFIDSTMSTTIDSKQLGPGTGKVYVHERTNIDTSASALIDIGSSATKPGSRATSSARECSKRIISLQYSCCQPHAYSDTCNNVKLMSCMRYFKLTRISLSIVHVM